MDALDIKKPCYGCLYGRRHCTAGALKVPDRVLSLILTSTFASVSLAFKKALNLICELKEDTDPAVLKQLNLWMTYGQYTQIHHPEKIEKSIEERCIVPFIPNALCMPIRHSVGHASATIQQAGCMSLKCRY